MGEIRTVLDEADIQQIVMRIKFVLRVQSAFNLLFKNQKTFMKFTRYSPKEELLKISRLKKLLSELWSQLLNKFSSTASKIEFMDAQKRIEESIRDSSRKTQDEIRSIRFLFDDKLSNVKSNVNDSNSRIDNVLYELGRRQENFFNSILKEMSKRNHQPQQHIVDRNDLEKNDEANNSRQNMNYKMRDLQDLLLKSDKSLYDLVQIQNYALKSQLEEDIDMQNRNILQMQQHIAQDLDSIKSLILNKSNKNSFSF